MLQFTLEQGSSFTVMFTVLGAALLVTAGLYYRAFRGLRRGQWHLLLVLRAVAIVIVVVLLFRPGFTYYKELKDKPGLVFLLDRSKSMSIADDASGATRFALARQQVEKWWARLKGDFELSLIEFSERAQPVEKIEQLDAMLPDGPATSISRALVMAVNKVPQRTTGTAVLLSDGLHNSARSPLEIATKLGMPVHTVGVGASLRSNAAYRDLQVTAIDCPERMMLNNKAQVTASVEGIGLAGHVTPVFLDDEGKQIQAAELTLDDLEGSQKVTFEFVPTVKGRHTYTVRVPPAGTEKITENNQRSAVTMVVESGIRVLYVEGTLRGEYGALVDRFLARDPDLQFCALVQTRKNVFLERSNIADLKLAGIPSDAETLAKFDVFILGDLDTTFLKPTQQELIARRVEDGAGLIMLGGYHSLGPGGYEGTPIGKLLPVRLGGRDVGQVDEAFLPVLTPEAAVHPIFANIAGFFPTKNAGPKSTGLPPLDGCTRVEAARPGATVLATHAIAGAEMPVLAVQPVGKGRTCVFTGDTTRKWQQGPRAMDQESPFLQFWGQTVRWLAGRAKDVDNQASVVATTDKAFYEPEEPVRIEATVRDQRGEGTNAANVTAEVSGPGGRPEKVALAPQPSAAGHYAGTFEPRTAGKHQVVVEARVGDAVVKADKLNVDVGRPNLEFEKLDLDERMLTRIASDSGGRYVHISTADHLVDQLDKTQRKRRLYQERRLYWPPGLWVIFVSVLTVEWVLRKRFQLR
jgi:uncharacterized membrane protein